MKTRLVIFVMLVILLASCTPVATTSVTPTEVDANAIRTQAVGTAMFALTQQATDTPATAVPSLNLCMPPANPEKFNADRSDQGYFLGVVAISGYYTLLNAGLPEEAYKLLSVDAQKTSPRNQYIAAQKKNIKTVQIVTIEPYVAWQQQQGIIPAVFDRTNKITFYVQIKVSGESNPNGDLQTLFLTLVLAEPEHTWKIDTFATQFVAPEAYVGSIPSTFYSFSADRNYYDALVVIGKHYTLFNQGLYEQAYQFYSSSAQIPNLKSSKEYVASIQLFKIKVERVIGIYPIYKPARELWCATPNPGTNGLDFGIGIYVEGENGNMGLSNGIHGYYLNMILENGEWKIYELGTGSGPR